jgi:hypothetical protein
MDIKSHKTYPSAEYSTRYTQLSAARTPERRAKTARTVMTVRITLRNWTSLKSNILDQRKVSDVIMFQISEY